MIPAILHRPLACWLIFATAVLAMSLLNHSSTAETWEINGLGISHSRLSTVGELVQGNYVDMFEKTCLGGTNFTMHSDPNPVRSMIPNMPVLEGTTVWINEFQAVGHAM